MIALLHQLEGDLAAEAGAANAPMLAHLDVLEQQLVVKARAAHLSESHRPSATSMPPCPLGEQDSSMNRAALPSSPAPPASPLALAYSITPCCERPATPPPTAAGKGFVAAPVTRAMAASGKPGGKRRKRKAAS